MKWHNEKRKVDDLIPTEGNPRQMTEKQKQDLEASLKKFNLVEIPAINTDNRIISGHQRLKILQLLGRGQEEIDVRVPDRTLTEQEHREYLLRANKNLGEWDYDLLANFDEDILKDVGFESEELDKIFQLDADEDDFDAEAEAEKIKEPKVKLGDLYQLGEHRLLCGDSTKKEDVEKLMGGEKADMVFTDPPYNLGIEYNIYKDDKTKNKYKDFLERAFDNLIKFCGKNIFITCGTQNIGLWNEIKSPMWIMSWIKMNGQSRTKLGGMQKWEPVLTYELEEFVSWEPVLVYQAIRDRKIDVIFANTERGDNLREQHICPKPKKLIRDLVSRFSKREEGIVLDLFGGSGTTLIACEQLNRRCFMCEIDNRYCEVIINRWEKLTGLKSKKL